MASVAKEERVALLDLQVRPESTELMGLWETTARKEVKEKTYFHNIIL